MHQLVNKFNPSVVQLLNCMFSGCLVDLKHLQEHRASLVMTWVTDIFSSASVSPQQIRFTSNTMKNNEEWCLLKGYRLKLMLIMPVLFTEKKKREKAKHTNNKNKPTNTSVIQTALFRGESKVSIHFKMSHDILHDTQGICEYTKASCIKVKVGSWPSY